MYVSVHVLVFHLQQKHRMKRSVGIIEKGNRNLAIKTEEKVLGVAWQVQDIKLLKTPTCATRALWMEVCGSLVLPVSTASPCTSGLDTAGFPSWFWRPGLGRSSEEGWFRIAATHSSTWKCKKLFQEYLKNRSCSERERWKTERL